MHTGVHAELEYYERRWREYCAIVEEAEKDEAAHAGGEFAAHYRQHRRNMEELRHFHGRRWDYYTRLVDAEEAKARQEEERARDRRDRYLRGLEYEAQRRDEEAAEAAHAEPAVTAAAEAVRAMRAKLGTPTGKTERWQHYVAIALAAAEATAATPGLSRRDIQIVEAKVVFPRKEHGCLEQFSFEQAVRRLDPAYCQDNQLQSLAAARSAAIVSGDLAAILAAWEEENVAARAAAVERWKQLFMRPAV